MNLFRYSEINNLEYLWNIQWSLTIPKEEITRNERRRAPQDSRITFWTLEQASPAISILHIGSRTSAQLSERSWRGRTKWIETCTYRSRRAAEEINMGSDQLSFQPEWGSRTSLPRAQQTPSLPTGGRSRDHLIMAEIPIASIERVATEIQKREWASTKHISNQWLVKVEDLRSSSTTPVVALQQWFQAILGVKLLG